ncbi:MAG: type II toxin-antitoxin system RelB/DinJ family antitoxin [Chitinivibrionia bacterium]|nr:type II toxin-antitoxin system RelB/DinJ family antitoxin [Chitinivibrionia bacterium]
MSVVQIATKVDKEIRDKAVNVFNRYGLDLSTAIRMFLSISAKEQRIPIVSLDGDSFESDQKYFEQIPGFLEMLDKESTSKETYTLEEAGWNV